MNVQMGNERIEKGGMTLVAYVESKRSRFEPTILGQSIRKVLLFCPRGLDLTCSATIQYML